MATYTIGANVLILMAGHRWAIEVGGIQISSLTSVVLRSVLVAARIRFEAGMAD
jgi:hypothetical protein